MTGFTGIDWHRRTTEQMAVEFFTGPGAARCYPVAAAWTQIESACDDAGRELRAVSQQLQKHWQAGPSEAVYRATASLVGWLEEARESSERLAETARRQAVALTTARVAMPNPAEIQLADAVAAAARAALPALVGSFLAGPLTGAWAMADNAAHDQHRRAVRVMTHYEKDSAAAAHRWPAPRPPQVIRPPQESKKVGAQQQSLPARAPKSAATGEIGTVAASAAPTSLAAYSPLRLPESSHTQPTAETTGRGGPASASDSSSRLAATTHPAATLGAGGAMAQVAGERTRLSSESEASTNSPPLPQAITIPPVVAIPPVLGGPMPQPTGNAS